MCAFYYTKYGRSPKKKKKTKMLRIFRNIFILLIVAGSISTYLIYRALWKTNVWIHENTTTSIYIPTGATFNDVKYILYEQGLIINRNSFEWLAKKKKYPALVKPGRYIIKEEIGNNELINLLRSGMQTPVNVVFNNIRTKNQLAQIIAKQIEADSTSIMQVIEDTSFLKQFNLAPKNSIMIFIPNTYEFYWNTDARDFVERMGEEYNRFWNTKRMQKLGLTGITKEEVIILASIVEKETTKDDEKPLIASVYINRLNNQWLLQADPTLVYALGDFNIKRVLNEHKKIDSPYNTYKNAGLPPGPICIPSIASIDAVLNFENTGFMFFCAKDDLSGYHNFAKTNRQHQKNARKFQQALDRLNIKQ